MTNAANGSGLPNFRNLGDAIDRSGYPDAVGVVDVDVTNEAGQLLAIGRATYATAP